MLPPMGLSSSHFMIVLIVAICAIGGFSTALINALSQAVKGYFDSWNAQHNSRLKQDMIARGMSAEEIERVLAAESPSARAASTSKSTEPEIALPTPSEVVTESGGEWYPSIVLKTRGREYYVHYVGHDQDSDEWVDESRVRFPLSYFSSGPDYGTPPGARLVSKGAPVDPEF